MPQYRLLQSRGDGNDAVRLLHHALQMLARFAIEAIIREIEPDAPAVATRQSSQTVLDQINRMRDATGVENLITMLQFGVLNDELTKRNMERFATDVMPKLR